MSNKGSVNLNLYDVIRYPVVTEKSTKLSEHNQLVFVVQNSATKYDIKSAVESIFKVKVEAVNTLIRKGKQKRFKGRKGVQIDTKRAIITLQSGQNIDLGSGV
jgi:large subunit ribosomal protein L23